jgi:hypothetical protein
MSLFPPLFYKNPFRDVNKGAGPSPERIDQGVDYGGVGPVYAVGPGYIQNIYNAGWGPPAGAAPGAYIQEHLTKGIDKGRDVYVAEGIDPTVKVGQKVNANTVIGNMNGGGIETGWASPIIGESWAHYKGEYTFPTESGRSYNNLLVSLGAPSGTINGVPANKSKGAKTPPPINGGKIKTTGVSVGGAINNIKHLGDFLGYLQSADLWERIGLVVLGGIIIIVGLVIISVGPAKEVAGDVLSGTRAARSLGRLGSGGGSTPRPTGPTPEMQADRSRRLELAERNTSIGETKAQTMQMRERRLALARPKSQRHASGVREPNPVPSHN